MYYINTKTLRYPLRPSAIRAENPDTSFAQVFVPPDWYALVYPTIKPTFDEFTQDIKELVPIQVDGIWTQQWEVVSKFVEYIDDKEVIHSVVEQEIAYKQNAQERLASQIRSKRNDLLVSSDWTQISDATVDKTIWATYRQELRNITNQADFPWTVLWPTKPE